MAVATDPRLPFELISKVMDNVDILELVLVSHVCRAWRHAARAHPTFWRDIKLVRWKTASLDFFQSRLCAHTSGINLDVSCYFFPPPATDHHQHFRSIVLPAVQRNLFRIIRLSLTCIDCTDNLYSDVLAALTKPAPMLQDLSLTCRLNDFTLSTLPTTLFDEYAPRLRNAYIKGVVLPGPSSLVTAFQQIESLRIHVERNLSLHYLLAHFPALKQLWIRATSCRDSARITFARHPLSTLDVSILNSMYTPFFAAFHPSDLAAITHLKCHGYGANGWMHAFLSVFEGPVTLTVRDTSHGDRAVYIELSSADPADDSTRTFYIDQNTAQGDQEELWSLIKNGLFTPELLRRVSRFRLLSQRAAIVPEMGDELPTCAILEICFDGRKSLHNHPLIAVLGYNRFREPYALQFPAVHTIICRPSEDSAAGVTIAADELCALLSRVIRARPSPLKRIELAGVQLTGDIRAVEDEYGCAVVQRNN